MQYLSACCVEHMHNGYILVLNHNRSTTKIFIFSPKCTDDHKHCLKLQKNCSLIPFKNMQITATHSLDKVFVTLYRNMFLC